MVFQKGRESLSGTIVLEKVRVTTITKEDMEKAMEKVVKVKVAAEVGAGTFNPQIQNLCMIL